MSTNEPRTEHAHPNQSGRPVTIDRAVLNDLIRRSDRTSDQILADLSVTQSELFRWRYRDDSPVPPTMIQPLARAIGATIQELLHIPADSLVDTRALANGLLVTFGEDGKPAGYESGGMLSQVRMLDRDYKPVRRQKLLFGMDGLLMGPYTPVPGRPRRPGRRE